MSHANLLQVPFLDRLQKDHVPVSIFLLSGIKLHGIIEGHDDAVILLKNVMTQMVFKHAVSTVVPSKVLSESIA